MPLRTLQRPRFVCVLLIDWALTMKTLERQWLHSNAERWNDEKCWGSLKAHPNVRGTRSIILSNYNNRDFLVIIV